MRKSIYSSNPDGVMASKGGEMLKVQALVEIRKFQEQEATA